MYVIARHVDRVTGKVYMLEDEHTVQKFKCMIPPNPPKQPDRGVSFFAVHGGQRNVRIRDIVDIR